MPSIAKNTAFMTIASVGQKIISFFYFAVVARMVGVEDLGKYGVALSFTTIMVVFVDLGFTNVFVREAAKKKEELQSYFSTVLFAKLLTGGVIYIATIILASVFGYEQEVRHLIYLSAVTMLFDSFQLTAFGAIRAMGNLKYESMAMISSQFFTLILGSIFLFLRLPLIFLILAFTIPSACSAIYAATILKKKFAISIMPRYDRAMIGMLLRIAFPFALAAIFARLYSNTDMLLVKSLAGNEAAGWYATPYKIAYAFQFIPLALVAGLYPLFSEYFVSNRERLQQLFHESVKYLLLIAVPIAIGIFLLAEDITVFVFGPKFLPSVLPLKIIILGIIFSFLSFPFGALLNAGNKQTTQTAIVGIVMVVNILLNILLIPQYGAVGAAWVSLIGGILLTLLGALFVPKLIRISFSFLVKTIFQIGLAVLGMAAVVWYTDKQFHFFISIAAGVLVYVALLFATRAITKNQITHVLQLVRR